MEQLWERLEKMHCMVLNTSDASQVVYPHQIPSEMEDEHQTQFQGHGSWFSLTKSYMQCQICAQIINGIWKMRHKGKTVQTQTF